MWWQEEEVLAHAGGKWEDGPDDPQLYPAEAAPGGRWRLMLPQAGVCLSPWGLPSATPEMSTHDWLLPRSKVGITASGWVG